MEVTENASCRTIQEVGVRNTITAISWRANSLKERGCWISRAARAMAPPFWRQLAKHVTGVDISQEAVDAARDKYQKNNLDYVCGSVTAIPLPDHSVDMVVSFETIEHLTEQTEMLAEIRRVLIPEGILVISSPDKLTYSDIPGYHNEFHVKELYEDEFVALLQGFFPQIRLYRQNLEYGFPCLLRNGKPFYLCGTRRQHVFLTSGTSSREIYHCGRRKQTSFRLFPILF